jgi:DNA polymerase I-like protein with 3'-5' exonuclease and polymerase domains
VNYLVLDCETTTKNKGNPFTPENKLCIVSYATAEESGYVKIEYDDEPYAAGLQFLQQLIGSHDLLVGFNFKFDLHWFRRYGLDFSGKRVWDCQLVQFYLGFQQRPYPSLDESCGEHKLQGKNGDRVREYWDRGVDTPEIPLDVLVEYGVNDAEITRSLFLSQHAAVLDRGNAFRSLVNLHNADLLVTQEMEWNGLPYDVERSLDLAAKIKADVIEIDRKLADTFGADWINWESPQQLSSILYGGNITRTRREQVGFYKSGQKIGQPRFKVVREEHAFRRLVDPVKGSQLEGGGWSVAEDVLRSVKPKHKATRDALDLLLHRSKLEKLRGTYYEGLPELISRMGWTGNCVHGSLNHVVTRTGRLSSSQPNLQNITAEVDKLFKSRFDGGMLVSADAKGLEWVCIVYLSQDEIGILEVTEGVDQHLENQARFGLPTKRVAKFFVFRLIYGGTAYTYTKDPDFTFVSTKEDFWQDVMDKFYDKYRGIKKTHVVWCQRVAETGRLVTPSGREFRFYRKDNGDLPRTQILNYPVQSFGADLMAIARVSLFRRMQVLGYRSLLINTVHDSIVLDIYPGEWYNISTLVNKVFADIPENFKKLYGKEFNLPMKCDIKRLDGEEIINV